MRTRALRRHQSRWELSLSAQVSPFQTLFCIPGSEYEWCPGKMASVPMVTTPVLLIRAFHHPSIPVSEGESFPLGSRPCSDFQDKLHVWRATSLVSRVVTCRRCRRSVRRSSRRRMRRIWTSHSCSLGREVSHFLLQYHCGHFTSWRETVGALERPHRNENAGTGARRAAAASVHPLKETSPKSQIGRTFRIVLTTSKSGVDYRESAWGDTIYQKTRGEDLWIQDDGFQVRGVGKVQSGSSPQWTPPECPAASICSMMPRRWASLSIWAGERDGISAATVT